MIVVNFLPYWEEVQKKKTMVFWAFIAVVVLSGVLINIAIASIISVLELDHLERNNFLKKNLNGLQTISVDYDKVSAGVKFIEDKKYIIEYMHSMRQSIISFLKELAVIVPEGLYLTDVSFKAPMDKAQAAMMGGSSDASHLQEDLSIAHWELSGYSQNPQIISELIREIEKSSIFSLHKVGDIQFVPVAARLSSREKFSILINVRNDPLDTVGSNPKGK